MDEPLAQEILDILYRDSSTRRLYKDQLTDWIIDTQPLGSPLEQPTTQSAGDAKPVVLPCG